MEVADAESECMNARRVDSRRSDVSRTRTAVSIHNGKAGL